MPMPPEGASVEVPISDEGGNGNPPAAPSTPPAEIPPVTPAATTTGEPAVPAADPELFELPDGRKVDAATLTTEWKTNFLPEFTRKSQELARIQNGNPPAPTVPLQNQKPTDPLTDPEWQPKSYAELVEIAEKKILTGLEAKERDRVAAQTAVENEVTTQLDVIKKVDPKVNENALFQHAIKYGFRDLKQAHQNMKDMSEAVKKAQTTTVQNINKRNDPVSMTPGATGAVSDPSQFETARDYLRSLKK